MKDNKLAKIQRCLLETQSSPNILDVESVPGIYAFFLRKIDVLDPFRASENSLVYAGKSNNLAKRQFSEHFQDGKTGSSTLRRSIGAILKQHLSLIAIPRGHGQSDRDCTNYRFTDDGEQRLTAWMKRELEVGACPVNDPGLIEKDLIPMLGPMLNLQGWKNPQARDLRILRQICADEARLQLE